MVSPKGMSGLQANLVAEPTLQDSHNVDQVKILLVDDDEVFRALCARFLRRAPSLQNVTIQLAGTASGALQLIHEQEFDCLVVDYRLPDSTGTDMLSTLSDELHDSAPASIILTAGSGEEAAIQAIRVDAADFMPKSEVTRTSLDRAIANAIVKSRLQRSVSEQNAELKLAYEQLKKRASEIKQFYHNVSHEVKTPLTAIREFQQLLHDGICGELTEEQQTLVKYSLESCDQITLLFNDLLDATKLEFSKLVIDTTIQSPSPLIYQCISAIEPQAARVGITIVNNVDQSLPDVRLDKHRYIQIIGNLLSNALKFTPAGGTITVTSHLDSDNFYLSVSDNGCGIDDVSVTRVFDRLYQAPLGQPLEASSAGLGLGLSIAREIARRHNGDIVVNSEVGVGSEFTVSIPLLSSGVSSNAG